MEAVLIRGAYGYDSDWVSEVNGLECLDESLTVQSDATDADINTIVKRFGITGQLPTNVRAPMYGDFTEVFDFRSAQDAIIAARESFMEMPADVRSRFANDPALFGDFCSDPKNLDEMRKLGLAIPEKKEEPVVPPVPDKV
jgi:phage internal scaffolding protein